MSNGTKGCLIAVEGISGAGKTSLSAFLEKALTSRGENCVTVGGFEVRSYSSELTAFCRSLVMSRRFVGLPVLAEIHLLIAELVHDVSELVIPQLQNRGVVVFDGYWDSLEAFERGRARLSGRTTDLVDYVSLVVSQARESSSSPAPSCTVYLACPPKVAAARLAKRDALPVADPDNELQVLIDEEYRKILSPESLILDASGNREHSSVSEVALAFVLDRIKAKRSAQRSDARSI